MHDPGHWILLVSSCSAVAVSQPKPDLVIPDGAWVMFESIPMTGRDRTGGWRFRLDSDGCYRLARNKTLHIDSEFLGDTDPDRFWNTDWPMEPHGCLNASEKSVVQEALDDAKLARRGESASIPDNIKVSDGSLQRWTVVGDEGSHSFLIEQPEAVSGLGLLDQVSPWARSASAVLDLHAVIKETAGAAIQRKQAE